MPTYSAKVVCTVCGKQLSQMKTNILQQDCARLAQEATTRFVCSEPGHLHNLMVRTIFEAEPESPTAPVAGWDAAPVPAADAAAAGEPEELDPNDPNNELDASVPGGVRRKANGIAGHAVAAVPPRAVETAPAPPEPEAEPPRAPFDSSAKPS